MLQGNQNVLIKLCFKQREYIAWKLFGNKKTVQLGWQVGEMDSLWAASVRYVSKFNSVVSSSLKDYQDNTRETKGRRRYGFTTLSSSNCLTWSFIESKILCFIRSIVPCLFVSSPPKRSKKSLSWFSKVSLVVVGEKEWKLRDVRFGNKINVLE